MAPIGFLAITGAVMSFSIANALHTPKIRARVHDDPKSLRESYDYVIVGGGTAGLTVGDRLSEDGKSTVLVIENGEFSNSHHINWVRDRITWYAEPWWLYNLTSVPNKELHGQRSTVWAASVVGGSSALNGMQCVRGTRDDYNRWGSFFGPNSTWSWDGILPYFKRGLHFQSPPKTAVEHMPGLKYDESYWDTESRVYGGWPSYQWPGIKYHFEVFSGLPGVDIPEDSGAGKAGVFWYPTFMDAEGTVNRSYSRTGHWDGLNRDNYELIPHAKVAKIELDGNKATGVVFRSSILDGDETEPTGVKVNKEVILSAGTVHSPQLLQLSGIGPRQLLESAGIETKIELPGVGQSFHDHTTLFYEIKFKNYSIHPNRRDDMGDPKFIAWADELWNTNRTGPWSRGYFNTAAWLGLPVIAPDAYESIAAKVEAQNAADYLPGGTDPTVIAGYQARLARLAKAIRSKDDIFYNINFSGDEPVNYFTYEHPLSLGTININVSSPESEPVIDFRTYSNPVDFDILVELARFHRRMNVESPLLAQFEPVETSPGANVTSREDWVAYIRKNTDPTAKHPVGSCAMMPLELGGVVDEQLRVYGVEGLRVVDASVMNIIIGANTAGAVFAIAEKAADIIRDGEA
ncbi:hypothetical protein AJ79_07090 [Helicocarpus griseus UAMH5409]|uniref:Glucose-methanol-choline oxidoreductase N-terminal domain-containing protein n=1 Tax=Helicocarpus griseus UAMH5409 TaxID=1447875 RepID=A0A2B7X6N6_9EURO|nr:hypothetical protein AJ79_07090 [Helicocarpus griseus UAMH5409]